MNTRHAVIASTTPTRGDRARRLRGAQALCGGETGAEQNSRYSDITGALGCQTRLARPQSDEGRARGSSERPTEHPSRLKTKTDRDENEPAVPSAK
jgi:hypothetical protein